MREWLARLIDWFRRGTLDRELAEELRFHREHLERDALASGSDETSARWSAKRRLGNATRIVEEARARWSIPVLDQLQQDIRYAFRGLRRSPAFTTTVVITLALGIGANAVMFNVVDQLMLRPYPYLRDAGGVHRVYLRTAGWNRDHAYAVFPYTRYLDLRRWTTAFSHHAAFVTATHGVGTGEAARERTVSGVSASFFDFFDARPVRGRFFGSAEDSLAGGANVAVLGFDYWHAELGGRDVIGESIQVGNAPYTIIGVAPQGFVGITDGSPPAVFVPITAYAANEGGGGKTNYFVNYDWDWTQMIVRRRPDVTHAEATSDLAQSFVRSWHASRAVHPLYRPVEQAGLGVVAGPLKTAAGPDMGLEARTLLWVMGVAGIVLLIACANVANLFLARAFRRRREVALRLALGVSRGRLAAQAFTESLMLALLGCAAGLAIAQWGGAALRGLFIANLSRFDVLTDWRTLAIAVVAATAAAIATGMGPVLLAGREDLNATLKSGARGATARRSRARTALLVAQGALSVTLLIGAGLFVRSLGNVRALHLGYDVDPVLLVRWERRGTPMDSTVRAAVRHRLLETALARPDVERGAWVSNVPFGSGTTVLTLAVPGIDSVRRLGRFTYQVVSPDYFATVGTRVVRGRSFDDRDRAGAPPAVVVSEAIASTLWPGSEPLGRCMKFGWRTPRADTMPCHTVIGVVENAVHDPVTDLPLRYYLSDAQLDIGSTSLLLRLRRDPALVAEAIRRELQAVMPGQSHVAVQPAGDLVSAKRRSWRIGATMFVGFGLLALVVAAVGVYGVIAYDVTQRRHELGVRVALGAQTGDVVRLVLGKGSRITLAGVALGIGFASLAARWIEPLLFRQDARDPLTYGLVASTMLLVAMLACAVPAIRAARADPTTALRAD